MTLLHINCTAKRARLGEKSLPIRIGRGGYIPETRGAEGDEKTPLGIYHLRWGFYRADRLPKPPVHPVAPITWRALSESDGWCDADGDPAYNRWVRLPHPENHEKLWREDGVYDIILIISHNDSPPASGLGSAVFLHITQLDDRETLGCVAFSPNDMVRLLPALYQGMRVEIYE